MSRNSQIDITTVIHSDAAKCMYQALLSAGELALNIQSDSKRQIAKEGRDFATEADIKVQLLLFSLLNESMPSTAIIGEEDKTHQIIEEDFIVVDPIDGTFLYSAGSDAWGITIALISSGKPIIGFLYQPARNNIIYAEKGHGCYLNGKRVSIENSQPLSKSIIALVQGCWTPKQEILEVNASLSSAALVALCPGSAVDAGFEIIRGVAKAYLNYHGNIWDFAGLAIAVEEAGGLVSAPNGEKRTWDKIEIPTLFASSREIQKEIIELIPPTFQVK